MTGWSRDSQDHSWSSWAGDQSARERATRSNVPDDEGTAARRASIQSGTQSTEATASMDDHDPEGVDDRDQKDSELSSNSGKKDNPKTGKDYVPEYDGKTAMRDYERRVKLFEASTGIDESYRAQKLMERLSGAAWLATESLDLMELKHPKGVERLLAHLWQELEPLEYLRILSTLADFYKNFRRSPGQEYIAYDMEFRNHLKGLEEIGAKIERLTKAYWFIEKAGLSGDLRKQVVAAAGGEYDYNKLRRALMAIVPRVNKDEDGSHRPSSTSRHWKTRPNQHPPRQVHATMDGSLDEQDQDEVEETGGESERLEGELEVLLTQAARKRSQIEKARGYNRAESQDDRDRRIKSMKERLPCSACKAHGKTVYGHWRADKACPYHRDHKDTDKSVLAVIEEQLSDSESDQDALYAPSEVFIATDESDTIGQAAGDHHEVWIGAMSGQENHAFRRYTLALSDTCCARTVAGEKWIKEHLRHLRRLNEDVYVIDEARPFRFGAGPRIMSMYAVIIPITLPNTSKWAHLRVSVVDQDVPLLISKGAMKQLGVVLDLANAKVEFQKLSASVALRETKTGLCGFDINFERSGKRYTCPDEQLVGTDCEVVLHSWEQHREQDILAVTTEKHPEYHNVKAETGKIREYQRTIIECEDAARDLLRKRNFSYDALLELVRRLPIGRGGRHRRINDGEGPSNDPWSVGVYVHGKWQGITKRTAKYPHVTRYLNSFLREKSNLRWTSIALHKDVLMEPHVDLNNNKHQR